MIYITGDCHGDFEKFTKENFPEQVNMTKDDVVIICGDFGGVWHQESDEIGMMTEGHVLDWLESLPFTVLFVDGNHENFDRLYSFPVEERFGGKVHKLRENVLHLMRGEVFKIDGKKIFAFGGASSHDISDGILEPENWREEAFKLSIMGKRMYRVRNLSWWEEELPNDLEMKNGIKNLKKHKNKVDFIITHSPSTSELYLMSATGRVRNCTGDVLTDYLDKVRAKTHYKTHFFGHMHQNYPLNNKDICLYEDIIRIS